VSFFDAAYQGTPPWDIGRPQDAFVALAEAGEIRGSVLDIGCGTGENALYLASRGLEVWGVDLAPTAIEKARAKAKARGVKATFRIADALRLSDLGRTFDTAIDSGLFHTFSDEERPRFATGLARILPPEGRYFMMCFSEHEPADWGGPRRVTQAEIRAAFRDGWHVDSIHEARFGTHLHGGPGTGGHAWLASITRRDQTRPPSRGGRS